MKTAIRQTVTTEQQYNWYVAKYKTGNPKFLLAAKIAPDKVAIVINGKNLIYMSPEKAKREFVLLYNDGKPVRARDQMHANKIYYTLLKNL